MPAASPAPEALFAPIADAAPTERFCILHRAAGRRRGAVLHVHAFAEELNKTRRMVARQASLLAAAGFDVLLLDLLGCGDSPGHFEDASWPRWLGDVTGAAQWLRQQQPADEGAAPLWLWGTRLGALLAAAAAPAVRPHGLLFWQPVLDGAQHLQQFLRIADARVGTDRRARGGSVAALRQLADGTPVDVAGYRIAPALHRSLQGVRMQADDVSATALVWVESAASAATSAAQRFALPQLRHVPAQGPAFWLQVDSEDAPDWWGATTAAMLAAA